MRLGDGLIYSKWREGEKDEVESEIVKGERDEARSCIYIFRVEEGREG